MMISGVRWTTEVRRELDRKGKRGRRRMAAVRLPGDLLQLALDGARPAEQPPVDWFEPGIGCVEHEPARHADGDADRAAVEFDCKTLVNHNSSPREPKPRGRPSAVFAAARYWMRKMRPLRCETRLNGEALSVPCPSGSGTLRALESCGAATRVQLGAFKRRMLGHAGNMEPMQRESRMVVRASVLRLEPDDRLPRPPLGGVERLQRIVQRR